MKQDEPTPLAMLIDHLKEDGLADEAEKLNTLLRKVAWTTGTEFLGEFGLEMKAVKKSSWKRMSAKTKATFASAARLVKKTWPTMFYPDIIKKILSL